MAMLGQRSALSYLFFVKFGDCMALEARMKGKGQLLGI